MSSARARGLPELNAALVKLERTLREAPRDALPTIGNAVEANCRVLISGPGRGRLYTWRGARPGETPDGYRKVGGRMIPIKNRAIPHRASAPGDPPVVDTGALRRSIEADVDRPNLAVRLAAGGHEAPYAAELEFGGQLVAARPFLRRSVNQNPQAISGPIVRAIVEGIARAFPGRTR